MNAQKRMVIGMADELEFVCEKCAHYEVCDRSSRMIWARLSKEKVCTDFMEVVRCKDCKHYMEYPLNKVDKRMCCYVHLLTPHFTPEDGFCSYGERKEA